MTSSDGAFQLRTFAELSGDQLYEILRLRCAVFVLEQQCPYQELDGLDQQALHLMQTDPNGRVIAYARLLAPGVVESQYASIGRVVVSEAHRQHQLGQALMQAAINAAVQQYPDHDIKISAQSYLSRFYQQLGFVSTGDYYLEDQIPHQGMLYKAGKK